MLTTLKRRRWLGLTAVVVGVLVSAALGAVAYASIPDAGGVIQGCYKTASGDLRVIDDSNASCKAGETALDWNQQGIQGPQGPQGQQGPPGQDSVRRVDRAPGRSCRSALVRVQESGKTGLNRRTRSPTAGCFHSTS